MLRHILARRFLTGLATVLLFAGVGLLLAGAIAPMPAANGTAAGAGPSSTRPPTIAADQKVRFDPDAARARPGRGESVIVRSIRPRLRVFRTRGAERPSRVLRPLVVEGKRVPLVLLQVARRGRWLRVRLPVRPNGATGWVRARDVETSTTRMRIVIRLRRHRLELRAGRRVLLRRPIGVGRSLSPTPTGRYFVVDTLRPRDPNGFYGPYALGLSAYSPVYTRFAGGNGQVGIHGTNQPESIGRDVSAGCIRIDNQTISRLARRLPLGTPVEIRRH